MSALVEIRDMCKIYNPGENEVRALDHVSVTIDEGEFVAIIGHSASGKSTRMNMLGCLDVPSSCTYMLHGQKVSELDDDELSRLLVLRYVQEAQWDDIMAEMGYCQSHIFRLHQKAIRLLDNILKDESK